MAVLAGTTANVSKASGIAAAVFLFVFNSFFAVGWLGMTWLYPGKSYGDRRLMLRAVRAANALCS